MSIIIEFFTAPDDTAAAGIADRGPTGAFDSLACGNFDATEAVIEWESIFTGQSFETLVSADEPRGVTLCTAGWPSAPDRRPPARHEDHGLRKEP
jgi:hypothetical protein